MTLRAELTSRAWKSPDWSSATSPFDQPADSRRRMMPPAVHGNKAPTHRTGSSPECSPLVLGLSLVLDYLVRMKVSAHLNWFYAGDASDRRLARTHDVSASSVDLVRRLNAVGAEFRADGR